MSCYSLAVMGTVICCVHGLHSLIWVWQTLGIFLFFLNHWSYIFLVMIMFFLTYMIFLVGSIPLHRNTIRAWFFWKAFHLVLWIGCLRRKGKIILKTYLGSQKSTRKLPKFPIKRIDAFVKTRQVDWRSSESKLSWNWTRHVSDKFCLSCLFEASFDLDMLRSWVLLFYF